MDTARSSTSFAPDPTTSGSAPRATSLRVYSRLLRVYPAEFRLRYAAEMLQLFADQLGDARRRRGGAVAVTWIRALADLASSALSEHLRRNRTVAQSLTPFEPTRAMRWLGLIGLVGGALLLAAFVTFAPFETRAANMARLITFALAGPAVAIAYYRRQASAAPAMALVAAGAVVLSGISYAAWLVAALWIPSPFSGPFGALNMFANGALWLSATVYGAVMLKIGRAWQSMPRGIAMATRLGAIALVGSGLALLGDDRLGLVDSDPFGPFWSAIAMIGLFLNGAGWVLLGGVLVFARSPTRPS